MTKPIADIRILLIDELDSRAEALMRLLQESGYRHVFRSSLSNDLIGQVAEIAPDIVLVEIDSPKRDMLEQLATLQDQRPTPVAVFCQDAEAQSIRAAVESGVCAYVVQGIQPQQVKPAIGLAMSTFRGLAKLRNEAASAKEALAERTKVDRAKRLLMSSQGLSEEEAYNVLKKLAMDRGRKLADAADDLTAAMRIMSSNPHNL